MLDHIPVDKGMLHQWLKAGYFEKQQLFPTERRCKISKQGVNWVKMRHMIDWRTHIESNPAVMYGKPVIKNTRVPADLILEKLSEGETIDDLLEAYP